MKFTFLPHLIWWEIFRTADRSLLVVCGAVLCYLGIRGISHMEVYLATTTRE